jgi:hypothetical protein
VEVASSIKIQPGDDVRLVVILPYTPERVEKIKTISGQRWDAEQRYWTVPATTGVVERLVSLFTGDEVRVDPTLHRGWDTIKRILTAVKNELTLQRYSPKTHDVYLRHLGRFLNHFGRAAETLTSDELGDYFLGLVRSGISHSYQNQAISAVKFLYWHVLRRPEVLVDLPRPVRRKKRRYTIISEAALEALRDCWRVYRPHDWLFPGGSPDKHISPRTVQKAFEKARDEAEIRKDATGTRCATPSPPICWRTASIYDTSRSCWGTRMCRLRSSIPTSATGTSGGFAALCPMDDSMLK